MQGSETDRRAPVGAVLALIGGALLVVGSFLDWAEVSGTGTSVTASGTEGTDGWITFVAGAVLLVAGLALLRGGRRALAILAIVAGLVGGGVGLYDALTATDSVLDSAAEELVQEFGGSVAQIRALLDAAIEVGELGISISIGLYMVIAGGTVGIVGGALALRRASAAPATTTSMPGTPTATMMTPETSGTPTAAGTPSPETPTTEMPTPEMPATSPSVERPEIPPPPPTGGPPPPSGPPAAPEAVPPPSPWATEEPAEDRGARPDDEGR